MGFNPKTWSADESLTAAKMNQAKDSLNWLYAVLLPVLDDGCVADTDLGIYVVNFSGSNLIDPSASGGSGDYGATWTKLWGPPASTVGVQITIPSTIFSAAPMVVGHTTGSESQWGIIPLSRWAESATGYKVAFRDSGGDAYPISTPFSYSALLIGPRKSSPA